MSAPSTLAALLVLAAFLHPASAQPPALSPGGVLPGNAVPAAPAGNQEFPFVSPGNSTMLCVWQDSRTDLAANLVTDQSGSDIYASRLDPAGNPLDVPPIVISAAPGDEERPFAAWNGSNWLVVWLGQVPTTSYYSPGIQAVRVSPQGVVLDATPLTVVMDQNLSVWSYTVASDGQDWTIAWGGFNVASPVILGRRISAQGTFLDAAPITLHTPSSTPYHLDLAFAQDEYMLVWNHWTGSGSDDIFGRRLSPTLAPLGGQIVISGHAYYDVRPALATDGNDFFVAWERYETNLAVGGQVHAARINHQGQVLDLNHGFAVSPAVAWTVGREPSAAWDGSNWVVAWTEPRPTQQAVFVNRITPTGAVANLNGVAVSASTQAQDQPQISALPGGGAIVTWTDWRAGGAHPKDVVVAAWSGGGNPSPYSVVGMSTPTQLQPDLVPAPFGYLAVYVSAVSGLQRIVGQRLDAWGVALDSEPFEIAGASATVSRPRGAWNGSVFLIVWGDGTNVKARRLAIDGTPLDATPLTVMPGLMPDAAALADNFLVVCVHTPTNPHFRFPYSRRVRGSDGFILDAAPVQLGQYFAGWPAVTELAGRWLVAWQRNFSHDDARANVHATFVDASGVPTPDFVVQGGSVYAGQVSVAASVNTGMIMWHMGSSAPNRNVHFRRIDPAGAFLEAPVTLTTATNTQDRAVCAWTGSEFVAVYEDLRNASLFYDDRNDAYAQRISEQGPIVDPAGFAVSNTAWPEIDPTVAGSKGRAVFALSRFDPATPFGSYRIFTRALNPCPGVIQHYGAGCPGTGGFVPELLVGGCPTPGGQVELLLSRGLGGSPGFIAFGLTQAQIPLGGGCTQLIDPILPSFIPLVLGGTGAGGGSFSLSVPIPLGIPAGSLTTQAALGDPGAPLGLTVTNGVRVTIQ